MGNCTGSRSASPKAMGSRSAGPKAEEEAEQTQPILNATSKDGRQPPEQWQPLPKLQGSGQWERQGFEYWTPEEQRQWTDGTLTSKWGVGQVSIRLPIRGCLQGLALLYGYLPFIVPIWWAIWALATAVQRGHARFFPLYGLVVAAVNALVNETVTKQICKRTLPAEITRRPPEAVCKHPGMPSGHVMNAFTLMTWVFLEAVFDHVCYPEVLLFVLLLLGPVPWARVYNKDHTIPQVSVSAVIAILMGAAAYFIRITYFPEHHKPWEWLHLPREAELDDNADTSRRL